MAKIPSLTTYIHIWSSFYEYPFNVETALLGSRCRIW